MDHDGPIQQYSQRLENYPPHVLDTYGLTPQRIRRFQLATYVFND